jgi:hypothetical protein
LIEIVQVLTKHINDVFKDGELDPYSTCAKFAQVEKEGGREVTREIDFYNLDVIIAVCYRIKSTRGVLFRKWATQTIKQHLGFPTLIGMSCLLNVMRLHKSLDRPGPVCAFGANASA